jgi:hypothetical protein
MDEFSAVEQKLGAHMTPSKSAYTKPEAMVLVASGLYAVVNVAFVFTSAAGVLGPAWPIMFLWLGGLSAFMSIGVLAWWTLRGRYAAGFSSSGILAAIAVLHFWAAHASSAAI